MDETTAEEGGTPGTLRVRARHIKKRALKNKSLSVSFDEKDLKNYVTGFHKRKKKRRKEARQQQEEAERRKRIELRKKRKLEREFVMFGGAPPDSGAEAAAASDEELECDEDGELVASVSGKKMYDNGDIQVTVTTSEISKEEEYQSNKPGEGNLQSLGVSSSENKSKLRVPVMKKQQFKKSAPKKRSRGKPQSKRDKKKGKKKNKKQH